MNTERTRASRRDDHQRTSAIREGCESKLTEAVKMGTSMVAVLSATRHQTSCAIPERLIPGLIIIIEMANVTGRFEPS